MFRSKRLHFSSGKREPACKLRMLLGLGTLELMNKCGSLNRALRTTPSAYAYARAISRHSWENHNPRVGGSSPSSATKSTDLEHHPFNLQHIRQPWEDSTFVWGEEIADQRDGLEQCADGTGLEPPQTCLELCVGHFDGVQIRAVKRNLFWKVSRLRSHGLTLLISVAKLSSIGSKSKFLSQTFKTTPGHKTLNIQGKVKAALYSSITKTMTAHSAVDD